MKTTTWRAERLGRLPPYLFVEIDRKRREAIAAGKDVISFGVGDPDRPTPGFIVERMAREIRNPVHHRYPVGAGSAEFVESCLAFFERRFRRRLERTQITALIGSKEGIGHLPLAVVNPGEVVLIPDPGYPVYTAGTLFAGGAPQAIPLQPDRGWLPDLEAVPPDAVGRARLMFVNYPNNPTGATTDLAFLQRVIRFAREHQVLVAHDAAYSEMYFDRPPPSILEVEGAFDWAVEFHSLSKTFNMTGWRIGFAVGNPEALAALAKVKDNLDSGPFGAIQAAAAQALDQIDHPDVRGMVEVYRRRRDIVVDGLRALGITVERPQAGFYVWARCPAGFTSMEFVSKLLSETAVVVIPGTGFGAGGEGYFRLALTVEADRCSEAMSRLGRVRW